MAKYLPQQGDTVIFVPRVAYGRQSELTALVTRVWDADDIEIVCFPCVSEPTHHRVLRQSEPSKIHCWKPAPAGEMLTLLLAEVESLRAEIDALKGKAKKAA